MAKNVLATLLITLMLAAACSRQDDGTDAAAGPPVAGKSAGGLDAGAIAENNRGVGLMGQFDYAGAHEVFRSLAGRYPRQDDIAVNLAIATLNRQQEGDENKALEMVEAILARDPDQLRARYVAGLLQLYLASPADALEQFARVAAADPADAYAAYYLGQSLAQAGRAGQALDAYRKALKLDPYLRSAYYGAFQALRKLRRADEARALIGDYQRLANNPRAHLAEFKYTRMGPKAQALAFGSGPAPAIERPAGPVFGKASTLPLTLPQGMKLRTARRPEAMSAVDIDGDGRIDLFAAGMPDRSGGTANLVALSQPDGGFQVDAAHRLAAIDGVNATLWGDYDNDGLTDVYLLRNGPNQLWRQRVQNHWEDVTDDTGTAGGDLDSVDGAILDADHDGDLDLFVVNGDGANELFNNNLDGTFRPIAADRGLEGAGAGALQVLPVDLDRDRDVDLVVINRDAPHEVYLNDRLWDYRPAGGFGEFSRRPALAVIAADIDADGSPGLFTLTPDGEVLHWQSGDGVTWRAETLGRVETGGQPWGQLAAFDADGDGDPELTVTTAAGWWLLDPGRGTPPQRMARDSSGTVSLLLQPERGYALAGLSGDGTLALWPPGPGRQPFLALSFSGKADKAQSMRSNASGIGTTVTVRSGTHWSVLDTWRLASGPGQGLQPLAIGLGGREQADFITIDWSDGVYQSELSLAPGGLRQIVETQRQLSSCPVLFAWDGSRYAFVSDLLGVGGIGYALGPGEYSTPRPWENFLLPQGALAPRRGHLTLKISEPMEETAYLDSARLLAWDLPPGWDMTLDERMNVAGPEPTGGAWFYRTEALPRRAVNERGEDVTAAVARVDGRAAPVGTLDSRFIGRLAGRHILTLEFDEPLDGGTGTPVLVADGWVEYPYSQTMFAAWQAGAEFHAPTIEARGADGRWRTVLEEFGYPAGMPRRMAVALEGLPRGTRALRIGTNMEIYWDRLAVARVAATVPARSHALPLVAARVAATGFAQRHALAQRRPNYDYARRSPFWDTRYMAGNYTRFGAALELVGAVDDAVAIIGPGEELHLEFEAPPGPPPDGWTRRYVLETNGWAKDMDLFTLDGETVGPLPDTGRPAGPRDTLHARYNTRHMAGR